MSSGPPQLFVIGGALGKGPCEFYLRYRRAMLADALRGRFLPEPGPRESVAFFLLQGASGV